MADDLYTALRNADAAGDVEGAKKLAAYIQSQGATPQDYGDKLEVKRTKDNQELGQNFGNAIAGAVRGAGSIGATILSPIDAAVRATGADNQVFGPNGIIGRTDRRSAMDQGLKEMGAEPDSVLYGAGKIGAEIAGTAGVGPVLGAGVKAVSQSPRLVSLADSLSSGGFTTGNKLAQNAPVAQRAENMLTRVAGGAGTGAATAGAINPNDAGTGAVIGGVLPPSIAAAGGVGGYIAKNAGALAQPFTKSGQNVLANKIIDKFAEGGPTALNAAELVPGSVPTLAEATGNAGIAGLQRSARDINPNAFVEREAANNAARNAAFDSASGDASQLAAAKTARSDTASDLYGQAVKQYDQNAEQISPYVKGQITQLLKRPSIDEASRTAQKLAMERGEKPAAIGSLPALHDVKTALDDKISEAVRAGKGGEASALQATKEKLLYVMEQISPAYGDARSTYAQMSQPVNAMEALQGLNLTDAKGNMTLAKVQNALDGLQSKMTGPGTNAAKSITKEQLGTLTAIRDDLLRQSNLGAGKSAGSNTFQNIATDNIIGTMLPHGGNYVTGKVGGLVGQAGQLLYNKPNEAIRNRLVDIMLDPQLRQVQQQQLPNSFMNRLNGLNETVSPFLYRAAPVPAISQ